MIDIQNISKSYWNGQSAIKALCGVSLQIAQGDFIALTGPSGCGKSTLIHLMGAMDTPDSGDILFQGRSITTSDDEKLTRFRRDHTGVVFQFFNLLPTLTVEENAMLPLILQQTPRKEARARAYEWLERVKIDHRHNHYPHQLSGGEMQRTAIARALVHRPALLLADEPTGNLDSKTGAQILDIFAQIAAEKMTTLILVTHDPGVAQIAPRHLHMTDGQIISDQLS